MTSTQVKIAEKIKAHKLPDTYANIVNQWLSPITHDIAKAVNAPNKSKNKKSFILGVQGTQGSGKSTASEFIQLLLQTEYQLTAAVLSIDDFYLTIAERETLSQSVHPLLKTRGVPGTHDIDLAIQTIKELSQLTDNQSTLIPRFEKAIDDRAPQENWSTFTGSVDVIILEGWCIGLKPEQSDNLIAPINSLENQEDATGAWRQFVNRHLSGQYQELFSLIDKQLVLNAPSFDCVYNWRLTQEHKLIERIKQTGASSHIKTLSDDEVKRFISHYERLTKHALKTMPKHADWCLWLSAEQTIEKMTTNTQPSANIHSSLVITDLDGTLLDHHSYSWQAAASVINKLKEKNVPIVINTSKTVEEVIALQKDLNITMPFIVENGSALYFPKSFVADHHLTIPNTVETKNYYYILFGENRKAIIDVVYTLKQEFNFKFSGYYEWSVEDVIERTGLSQEAATASVNRQYSEPLIWEDTDAALEKFKSLLKEKYLTTLKGGRFLHVLGETDKAKPIVFLENLLAANKSEKLNVICLGDSYNDAEMLAVADFPVWVKSPTNTFPQHKGENTAFYTTKFGPEGWREAIEHIFSEQLYLTN